MAISISKIPSEDEGAIVSRVLLNVNKAIEKHFPNVSSTDAKFRKTVFSTEEATALNRTNPDRSIPKNTDTIDEQQKPLSIFRPIEDQKPRDWLAIITVVVFLLGLLTVLYLFMI